ncbi:hypothetical protein ACFFJQ_14265 [Bacillus capparidis]|uniref:Uncharacterized protein n=1 Tax=Bacillus capparidis TaxID=1840411 RepID=A0ABS4CT64_9BACI|nr:hypothetical protein [Bacillus capparidis]MBP1080769.1 hypothetical protein [Bacillus capparidis]MED1094621.1 hypothetical protein [Bacillus capparidis]
MLNVNEIKERKKIRLEILEQLYDLYFHPPTQNQALFTKRKELIGERNSEKHLAYHYLLTSGYIHMDVDENDRAKVMIKNKGIDYVEAFYEEKENDKLK